MSYIPLPFNEFKGDFTFISHNPFFKKYDSNAEIFYIKLRVHNDLDQKHFYAQFEA